MVLILGVVVPRLKSTRLDAREIRCSQNLKSIAQAAKRYQGTVGHAPESLTSLIPYGLGQDETNCPAAPPTYRFSQSNADLVVCPNHRVHLDGSSYRVTAALEVHTSGTP
jgi:hypothetical protein